MVPSNAIQQDSAEWLKPVVEQAPLQRYLATLRERAGLVLLTVVLTTVVALAYVLSADKLYEAQADLLITPVPRDDVALSGLGLIRESTDPTRDVETAAHLVTTTDVARAVTRQLRLEQDPQAVLQSVRARPVAQSNIVAVTAQGESPEAAQGLANGFAAAAVENRTRDLRAQLDKAIDRLRTRVDKQGAASRAGDLSLGGQLAQLETLRSTGDPTMRVETRAAPPAEPIEPRPLLSIVAGLVAGLVLGVGGAFALQALDPRLRREEQLRNLYRLPIVARVPHARGDHTGAIAPERLPPAALEGYRTLRATLAATRGSDAGARSILVTSASPSEGKTTTAVNLASSLALAGNRVILIEADLRRPAVGQALGETAEKGTGQVLLEMVALNEALVTTSAYQRYLRVLLAEELGGASGWMADRLFLPAAEKLISQAKGLADYVIIDSPPLSEVIDALPLAKLTDEVLLVTRIGKTRLQKLSQLAELLAHHGVTPVGFAVIGSASSGSEYYYYSPPQLPRGLQRLKGAEPNASRAREPAG